MKLELMDTAKSVVRRHLPDAVELSDALYKTPELAYCEIASSKRITAMLCKAGFEVEYPFLEKELGYGTAFRAVLQNGEGPAAALMVEYDALPGIGHGCGHNLHGALSVLAALSLAEMKEQFQGSLYVIGTPAEEENGAKVTMADCGVFDGMALAAMMHSWSGGTSQANMDVLSLRCYVVEFFGAQAHAVAAPWKGRSALAAARKFLDLIDARRECFTPDIHVNGVILDGGKAPNIIPDHATIRLEFRTDSRGKLEELDTIVRKCANGAALALDCDVTFTPGLLDFWDMVRVAPLEQATAELLQAAGETVGVPLPATGSSDVGNVSYRCPTIQPLISINHKPIALHTTEMCEATRDPQAQEALARGAEVLTNLFLKIYNDAEFCGEVEQSFREACGRKQQS